ncbi:hypothetical protein H8356DRAFT_1436985 [Neocallimastix lanati (nom. inval.)]|nr:hypothetical protein H8356DRAFT_1436985 [Neocallimastix sp. JGI-2020a]
MRLILQKLKKRVKNFNIVDKRESPSRIKSSYIHINIIEIAFKRLTTKTICEYDVIIREYEINVIKFDIIIKPKFLILNKKNIIASPKKWKLESILIKNDNLHIQDDYNIEKDDKWEIIYDILISNIPSRNKMANRNVLTINFTNMARMTALYFRFPTDIAICLIYASNNYKKYSEDIIYETVKIINLRYFELKFVLFIQNLMKNKCLDELHFLKLHFTKWHIDIDNK